MSGLKKIVVSCKNQRDWDGAVDHAIALGYSIDNSWKELFDDSETPYDLHIGPGDRGHCAVAWYKTRAEDFGPIITAKEFLEIENTGRRTFRLRQDTEQFKKGTLVQEKCDDGDQVYVVLDFANSFKFDDADKYWSDPIHELSRKSVENNPKWFEEVFPASIEWLTKEELSAFKEWSKKRKAKKTGRAKR